ARRAPARAPGRSRVDADRARGRPFFEGVRQPDRAREDAPDAGDRAVARAAPRRRPELPLERRLERRSQPDRDCADTGGLPAELELRALAGEGWARMEGGDVRAAVELLGRARAIAESPTFSDVDR